ncbi:family 61 glycosyl hydrolase [Thozetella sp. PMI_491]|nr:family 61 glycosyl hydrolase [Thozetella sp. PMI_491]
MHSLTHYALGASLCLRVVMGHGLVSGIMADNVYYEGYNPNMQYNKDAPQVVGWSIPQDQSLGFISAKQFNTPDMVCHTGATPAPIAAKVTAGTNVTLYWTPWPDSHHGPVMDYLAPCNGDCASVDKNNLAFFKIDAVGLLDGSKAPGVWADDEMISNNNTWTVKIPASIAPGNYVLRHETIALHEAQNEGGAQAYPQCVNLEVSSQGADTPEGVVATKLYTPTDPGIKFNIYQTLSEYPMPGPTLYAGAA